MDKTISLPVLTDSNYQTWRVQMKMLLMRDNLFGFIDDTEIRPNDADAALPNFIKREQKALANIVLGIDPKLLYIIGDPTKPKEVWDKLQAAFMKPSWANKLRLKKRLCNLRLNAGDSMQTHLKNFTETYSELAMIGEAVAEDEKVIQLLASLPEEYATIVTAFETCDQVPQWVTVTEKLLHEETKIKGNAENTTRALAHQQQDFKRSTKGFQNSKSSKKNVKCYNCGKTGHIKSQCWQRKDKQDANATVEKKDDDTKRTLLATALSTKEVMSDDWIIDSGASSHMSFKKEDFVNYKELETPIQVQVGNGGKLQAIGNGDVPVYVNGKTNSCIIKDVLYVPGLVHKLLSVKQMTSTKKEILFNENNCIIKNKLGETLATGRQVGKLYLLNCCNATETGFSCSAITDDKAKLWHCRLGHVGQDKLNKLCSSKAVRGLDCKPSNSKWICDSCCAGKLHKLPFPSIDNKHTRPVFDLVHTDVCGKIGTTSLGGGEYFVTFIDDKSRYCWISIIKRKSEVFTKFKEFKVLVENQYNCKIKRMRSDNGGEYCSNEFENYLTSHGIIHERTVPKNPQQNGVAERMNRTLLEMTRSMIHDAKVPKTFWGEAVNTAAYIINRLPCSSLGDRTPYEILNGHTPNVAHLRRFGSVTHMYINDDERSKLDPKSRKGILVGYGSSTKGYRVYDVENKRTCLCRNVIVDENKVFDHKDDLPVPESTVTIPLSDESVNDNDDHNDNDAGSENRKSNRTKKTPNRFGDWIYSSVNFAPEPTCVSEALSSDESDHWKSAMDSEMSSIDEHKVWSLTDRPKDCNTIKCKWIFKRKISDDGSVRYKARLVAQGFTQRPGIDYDETFSPVVRFESIRAMIAHAAKQNWHIHQMDVSTAFLNGEITENLYLEQPEGYLKANHENQVCKLHKALYGLKQSSKCWNVTLDNFLKEENFTQTESDPCLYSSVINGYLCIIGIYVDDLILMCEDMQVVDQLKNALNSRFRMRDLGKLNNFLGVKITESEEGILISQETFVNSLLHKFRLNDANSVSTPAEPGLILEKSNEQDEPFDKTLYQSAVGSLLFLSTRSRPDISYAVGRVAQFCSNPNTQHWNAVKRIMRYLKGTVSLGLMYKRVSNDNNNCVGYSDADWAGDRSDRKSTSGYCFALNGSVISWRSRKQSCVALSTSEAEYVALASAGQEAIWLKRLLNDLNAFNDTCLTIFEDNQAALCLAKNSTDHKRSKHIDLKYHFIRDQVASGKIAVQYCPTNKMIADIFTKPLSRDRFVKLRGDLGMSKVSS